MPTDKRAQILEWIEHAERFHAAATPGPWLYPWGGAVVSGKNKPDGSVEILDRVLFGEGREADYSFAAFSREALPLALAALRAEVEEHRILEPGLYWCVDCQHPELEHQWPCDTIERLHASLGLPDRSDNP